jgi:hypothetical protein
MKKLLPLIATMMILPLALGASCAAFGVGKKSSAKPASLVKTASSGLPSDVPANHPAAPAVQGMIKKAIIKPEADSKFHGEKPVTRYELAVVLDRLVGYIEASRKPLKEIKFPVSKSMLSAPEGSSTRKSQASLIEGGFVTPKSVLFKAPGNAPITAKELAQITAEVTTRFSDRSLPVTKDISSVD